MVTEDEKKAAAKSISDVGRTMHVSVDQERLSNMTNANFEAEIEELSSDIINEVRLLRKRFYEEGFKDALKQLQAEQIQASQPTASQEDPQQMRLAMQPVPVQPAGVSSSEVDAKINDSEQRLSDRITALEQAVLGLPSSEQELKQLITENHDLVSTLKSRLSEIAELQFSIEEKIAGQTPASTLSQKIDSLATQIDSLGDLVVDQGSKMNKVEHDRKASARHFNRRFKAFEEKLEDFKKVRKAIRKQGKRITNLSDEVVEKGSFRTALSRIRGVAKAKPSAKKGKAKRKARTKVVGVAGGKQVVLKTNSINILGGAKIAKATVSRATAAKPKTSKKAKPARHSRKKAVKHSPSQKTPQKQKISISSSAPATFEINAPKKN
ncbi:TPA: hypothetical protein HA244_01010 [Candidatus Micrarchaeota archaeon]|nr:hypothetical protein [Candidatus Micrarchaeota archaeon]